MFRPNFKQTVAQDTWTIQHNFDGNPTVSVKVYENNVLTEILPHNITFPDSSTVEITFTSPRTGEVRLT